MEKRLATLTVRNPDRVDRRGDTIVSGVPLPKGVVSDGPCTAVRDGSGARLPSQADILARWADGSAKWALLTLPRFSLGAGGTKRLSLGTGRPARRKGMSVTATTAGVRVDNGGFRFTIARTGPLVRRFDVKSGKEWRVRGTALDLLLGVERDGRLTRYLASRRARTVEIESSGPLRSVICVRGVHGAENGRGRFGPYVLRLEVRAAARQLRLTHSFVYDGDPERDRVRCCELLLTARVGSDRCFAFGGDGGREVRFARQRAPFCPDFRFAELFQDSATHWRIRRWVDRDRRDVFCAEGMQCDGWAELLGTDGRVTVAVREPWQNHPKSLSIDAAEGILRIGLYPGQAEPLDLSRYSDHSYPWTYEHPSFRCKAPVEVDKAKGAHGIRKTHDVCLAFDEPNPSAAALALNRPLLLEWAPSYTARTRVVVPAARKPDAGWLGRVNAFIDFLAAEMVPSGATGFLDYLDLPHGFNVEEGRWYHDFGGWGYINDEAMPCLGLWHTYLLTGRREAYDLARAMARHNGDIDSYVLGKWAGYGSRHNVNHWGDTCKDRRVSQPIGKRFLYYLAGDRSVADLAAVIFDSFRREARSPRPFNMTCDVPSLVATMLFLEETGLRGCERWLRAVADAIAASVDERGCMRAFMLLDSRRESARAVDGNSVISFMMFSCFGGAQAFAELAERYDHAGLRSALVRFARYQMRPAAERQACEGGQAACPDTQNAFRALDLLAYAAAVSGDSAFRAYARRHGGYVAVRLEERADTRYGDSDGGTRVVPVSVAPPDASSTTRLRWRHHYPLFPRSSHGQLFKMAVYMHKLQGLMALFEGAQCAGAASTEGGSHGSRTARA